MVSTQDEGVAIYWYWWDENDQPHPVLGYHESGEQGLTAFWPVAWGKGGAQLVVPPAEDAKPTMPESLNILMDIPGGIELVSLSDLGSREDTSAEAEPTTNPTEAPHQVITLEQLLAILKNPQLIAYYYNERLKQTIILPTGWTSNKDMTRSMDMWPLSDSELEKYVDKGYFSGVLMDYTITTLKDDQGNDIFYSGTNTPVKVVDLQLGVLDHNDEPTVITIRIFGQPPRPGELQEDVSLSYMPNYPNTVVNKDGSRISDSHVLAYVGNDISRTLFESGLDGPSMKQLLADNIGRQIAFENIIFKPGVDLSTFYLLVHETITKEINDSNTLSMNALSERLLYIEELMLQNPDQSMTMREGTYTQNDTFYVLNGLFFFLTDSPY
ncbi:hypothetical protein ACFLXI_10420, partial [Chloroflexota bacterium]